jgi:hypothetical protein
MYGEVEFVRPAHQIDDAAPGGLNRTITAPRRARNRTARPAGPGGRSIGGRAAEEHRASMDQLAGFA